MTNQEIVNYISSNIRRGVPYEDVHAALLARGHSDYDITEAVNFLNGEDQAQDTESKKTAKSITVGYGLKYFFLGFLCLIVLILIAIVLISVAKDAKENIIKISEGSLTQGQSFDLLKNNLIAFEHKGATLNLTIKLENEKLILSGASESEISPGETKSLDINNDDILDYLISYQETNKKSIFIQSICIENWECDDWLPCFGGKENRICRDLNACGSNKNKPIVQKDCISKPTIANVTPEIILPTENKTKPTIPTETIILSCEKGLEYNKKDYCTGEVKTVSNSTSKLYCCLGQIVDPLDFSDELRSIWTATTSSGNCSGDLYDALFGCSIHKCQTNGSILFKGVLGVTENYCAYYEELPDNKQLYCEYSENDRKNIVGYYFSESKATEVIHNASGTFFDGKSVRNYPEEALESGVCQIIV